MVPFLATGALLLVIWLVRALVLEREDFQRSLEVWFGVLRFFYYVFLGCYTLGATFRATSSVARERQQQTLEPLLLLPIERRDVLVAKWIGTLWRGWPWLALLLSDILLGVLLGVYHPFSAVLLCLAPWPLIFFMVNLGLLFSVAMQTVLRANLAMVLVVIALIGCTVTSLIGHSPVGHLEVFAFSSWVTREPMSERLLIANIILVAYALSAAISWKLAVVLFERRSQPST
jgi:ABC-type Na+ efflux pump permease subunit